MARKAHPRPIGRRGLRDGRRVLIACLLGFAVLAAAVTGYIEITRPPTRVATPAAAIGGPFELIDQDGQTVTDAAYRGKWLLIYFGYTHCPDACPTALSDIAEALSDLGPLRSKIQPLFITVDPQRDTPAVLKDYTAAFDAGIIGLTGSAAQIAEAAKVFRVYYRRDNETGPDYGMAHSSVIYLMDPNGRFVTNFSGEATPEAMRSKLLQVLS